MQERDLPCCIEAPDAYLPKARHALEMLLRPLCLAPRWVDRAALMGEGLYYGLQPEGAPAAIVLPLRSATVSFFERREALDPDTVVWHTWQGESWPILFDGPGGGDLVASAFYWLSGWQEWCTGPRDAHGRFPHEAALQNRLDLLTRPAVDAYRTLLGTRLLAAGVDVRRRSWRGHDWVLCPTHDIDYLRKWRPGIFYREFVHNFAMNRRRVAPAARLRRLGAALADAARPGDPCRTAFERMQAEVEARGGTATYFLKTAARDPHDVPYRTGSAYLRRRLDALEASGFEVGLHPGYRAHDAQALLADERDRLARLLGRPPRSVRQHYLRYALPETPRLHAALGFELDSTLGFAGHEGFRHATCLPFRLFDVDANAPLDVWEMPLVVMESALFNRRGLAPAEARAATDAVLQTCRRFGGACVALWHNTLWDEMDYPGWGQHFLDTLDAAHTGGALLASLAEAFDGWR